jgi:hypothetical protein
MSKKKIMTIIVLNILMASMILLAAPPVASQEGQHGGSTTNMAGGSIPLPSALTPDVSYPTLPYLSFRPNPIGVGQPLLVNVWLIPPIHVARYFKESFLITLTKPDGTIDEIGPLSSYYGDGTAWAEYVPDQTGTWSIQFDFLGAYFPPGNYTSDAAFTVGQTLNAPLGIYYKPSTDGPYEFEVTSELALSWPASPLPSDYWTRPVSLENREWWPIMGGYPATGIVGGGSNWPVETNVYNSNYNFIPYVQGPKSAHIVWRRQDALGGLIGGALGQISYDGRPTSPSIVYNGRAYHSLNKVYNGITQNVWQCYDLRTGEIYWEKTGITQVPTIISYVERTVSIVPGEEARKSGLTVELLFVGSGRVIAYDPWIGTVNYNISIAPLSTGVYYANPSFFLTVQDLGATAGAGRYRLINWTVTGDIAYPTITNRRLGILSNISWPFSSLGVVDYEAGYAVATQAITPSSTGVSYAYRIMAASITSGQVTMNTTTDVTKGSEGLFSGSTSIADHGKYAVRLNDGRWHCWDLRTGSKLWVSEISSHPWGIWGIYGVSSAYGKIFYPQYDGLVAYNWDDGTIEWRYQSIAEYPFETVYSDGNNPFYQSIVRIADGVIYVANDEHSVSNPIARGWKLHAVNATDGTGIWNITGSMASGAVADGYLTATNRDGYLYVFGKGKSATTVSVPQTEISSGTQVIISGTVMDMSPAQPNTACVSKDTMGPWMEYLHMQKTMPSGTGVPVSIDAVDPNGNAIHIADVTSDLSGTYAYTWAPDITGEYAITATFVGDDSYGSSWAETHAVVTEATETPPTQTPVNFDAVNSTVTTVVLGGVVAIIIAVALAAVLILRKKP